MWQPGWRNTIWDELETDTTPWDIIVIGGGITGAGVFREAARLGLKTLLLEQRDFAWGTSSRSSKLVHGGFRYLKQGKIRLTRASVLEREHLLHEAPGLIDPLGFLMTIYKGDSPGRLTMRLGLSVYDLLALRWDHAQYKPRDFKMLAPLITSRQLKCGFRYGDAQTDDSRLVLRVIHEAVEAGGTALNYAAVEGLTFTPEQEDSPPQVSGVRVKDRETDRELTLSARVVVNATGVWADRLREQVNAPARIRPLRGSHLVFPAWRLPVAQAIACWHPMDGRPVFVFPWEGVTLVGTTDVDHSPALDAEPAISGEEAAYLMAAVESLFPSLGLSLADVLSTFAGIRPVIDSGQADPSKESRDHVVWEENGLLTVTGGKLTTFRLIALDVLKALSRRFPQMEQLKSDMPVLNRVHLPLPVELAAEKRGPGSVFGEKEWRRLLGRHGSAALPLLEKARAGELDKIPGTQVLLAELRWAAYAEGVVHLEDLLLRRVRLGILLPGGGRELLPLIRSICQAELGWDDRRWEEEEAAYRSLWEAAYRLPEREQVPDWKALLHPSLSIRLLRPARRRRWIGTSTLAGVLLLAASGLTYIMLRTRFRKKIPQP
jgi:glycerol-3-phosphate dehydrogenase